MKEQLFKQIIIATFLLFVIGVRGQCYNGEPRGNTGSIGKIVTCGNLEIDDFISDLVSDCNGILSTKAQHYYYNDGAEPNALANPDDGNIYIGLKFLEHILSKDDASKTGLCCLIAHEMSHIFQFADASGNKLLDRATTKNAEIQADYLAGYILSKLKIVNNFNYNTVVRHCIDIGDFSFLSATHHGTPGERRNATTQGVLKGSKSLNEAYDYSFWYCGDYLDDDQAGKIVMTAFIVSGDVLYIEYGGKVLNSRYRQIGQMVQLPISNGSRAIPVFTGIFKRYFWKSVY